MRHKIIFHETKYFYRCHFCSTFFYHPPPPLFFSCIPSLSKMFLFYQQKKKPHAIYYSTCVRARNKHTYMLHIIYKKKNTLQLMKCGALTRVQSQKQAFKVETFWTCCQVLSAKKGRKNVTCLKNATEFVKHCILQKKCFNMLCILYVWHISRDWTKWCTSIPYHCEHLFQFNETCYKTYGQ